MKLKDAVELISPALPQPQVGKVWADLGSGEGLFTHALTTLLGRQSTVHAVDRSHQNVEPTFNGVDIVFHQLDFSDGILPFSALDGILMANSIHFIKDKRNLIAGLRKFLRPNGQLLIIEYELRKGNAWIPYPIPYASLEGVLTESGFKDIRPIGERQSIYGGRKMYACVAVNDQRESST